LDAKNNVLVFLPPEREPERDAAPETERTASGGGSGAASVVVALESSGSALSEPCCERLRDIDRC
jgi:hypothetical protein